MSTREATVARGLRLEYFTLGWNLLEALVALVAGFIAGSIALVGFGLDSVVEMSSGSVLLWRLRADHQAEHRDRAERAAVRLVGISFLALAAYVAFDSLKTLLQRAAPEESIPGIVLAAASLIVMPLLARAKRQVARGLASGAMQADSRQTDICAYLSAILLGGLVLNAALGWWWADPVAALIMVPLIAHEGIEAVQGKTCCHD
ncbi:MAG TPA: cation transporter [Terriglobales bacterium]|nr:cation transporter [Terriglobales bacterium]